LGADHLDLFLDGGIQWVQEAELGRFLRGLQDGSGQIKRAAASVGEMGRLTAGYTGP
jgi:hypothetical protein